jgi:hypothetical protein
VFFSLDWRAVLTLRFGLLMRNVPLPWYSAEKVLSSANAGFSFEEWGWNLLF